jgi:hypothetical protein
MTVSREETRAFLNTLFQGRIAESERLLTSLRDKHKDDPRYIHALEGILTSYVNDDIDSLLFRLYGRKELWRKRAEIMKYMERLAKRMDHEDRYFRAWADVLGLLEKVHKPHKMAEKRVSDEKVEEDNP